MSAGRAPVRAPLNLVFLLSSAEVFLINLLLVSQTQVQLLHLLKSFLHSSRELQTVTVRLLERSPI
jgi:hypothetical protein